MTNSNNLLKDKIIMNYVNIYVASYKEDELFSLKDFKFIKLAHEFFPGEVVKLDNGILINCYENNQLSIEEKLLMDENEKLVKLLNQIILENTENKNVNQLVKFENNFNNFMQGFCNRYYKIKIQ